MTKTVVFLTGLGQDASAWQPIADGLQRGWMGRCFAVNDLVAEDQPFTMAAAVEGLHAQINRLEIGEAVLCGLSLGSMIATSYAIAYPGRVQGLVLAASQVRANPLLMLAERAAVRLLPGSLLGLPEGLTKERLREILAVVGPIDYHSSLDDITAPTLALCGTRDKANLAAARTIAAGVPGARLELIEGAGHELNVTHAVEVGHALAGFLAALEDQPSGA
ncbi:MAG: alpha/beta fold hydrolase [Propionibacteriaceae bacterium]|nr:alpha/beta fold hydrolase [Propionibacteriaceae bacterium]